MAASPIASGSGSQAGDENDPLDLTSLDADSLFTALGAVEQLTKQAIPGLLTSVKPVLAHLTTASEGSARAAEEGVEEYMNTLDKIQFVLRQTVYYLRETHASTSALRPPPANALPTPFAASSAPAVAASQALLADVKGKGKSTAGAVGEADADAPVRGGIAEAASEDGPPRSAAATAPDQGKASRAQRQVPVGPELGLYGSRMEARVLGEMAEVLGRIQARGRESATGSQALQDESESEMEMM